VFSFCSLNYDLFHLYESSNIFHLTMVIFVLFIIANAHHQDPPGAAFFSAI